MVGMPPADDDVETVAEGRRYLLLGGEDGYSIWDLRHEGDAAREEFGSGEDALEFALDRFRRLEGLERRGRVLSILAWIVVVSGVLFLVYTVAVMVGSLIVVATADESLAVALVSPRLSGLSLALFVFPTAFTVAVGLYVVVWMQLRSRKRGD